MFSILKNVSFLSILLISCLTKAEQNETYDGLNNKIAFNWYQLYTINQKLIVT